MPRGSDSSSTGVRGSADIDADVIHLLLERTVGRHADGEDYWVIMP